MAVTVHFPVIHYRPKWLSQCIFLLYTIGQNGCHSAFSCYTLSAKMAVTVHFLAIYYRPKGSHSAFSCYCYKLSAKMAVTVRFPVIHYRPKWLGHCISPKCFSQHTQFVFFYIFVKFSHWKLRLWQAFWLTVYRVKMSHNIVWTLFDCHLSTNQTKIAEVTKLW